MTRLTRSVLLAGLLPASAALVQAQGGAGGVTFDRLQNAAAEPHNWLTYSGGYHSNRHTALDQITTANVGDLEVRWVFQAQSLQVFQTTPLVVDGRHVHHGGAQHGPRARRAARTGVLALRIHAGAGVAALLRAREPGGRDTGRHALHGDHRRATDRDRRGYRQAALEDGRRRPGGRPRADARPAHRQGQGGGGHCRRRVRHTRLHLGL